MTTNLGENAVWLPKPVYESLPYLYSFMGFLFVIGASYIAFWNALAPFYFGVGYVCLLTGAAVWLKRFSYRKKTAIVDGAQPVESP